jgi:hypothetical protein
MGEQGKLIDDDAVERAARSFGLRLDPFENVGRQPQVHPIGSPWFWRSAMRGHEAPHETGRDQVAI